MLIHRYSPWTDGNRLHHNLEQLARQSANDTQHAWAPRVDIYQRDEGHVLLVDVPGVSKDAISIEAEKQTLVIRGERVPEVVENTKYSRQERATGKFERRFQLPEGADTSRIEAKLEHGVLAISIPHKPETQPRKIEINAQ